MIPSFVSRRVAASLACPLRLWPRQFSLTFAQILGSQQRSQQQQQQRSSSFGYRRSGSLFAVGFLLTAAVSYQPVSTLSWARFHTSLPREEFCSPSAHLLGTTAVTVFSQPQATQTVVHAEQQEQEQKQDQNNPSTPNYGPQVEIVTTQAIKALFSVIR